MTILRWPISCSPCWSGGAVRTRLIKERQREDIALAKRRGVYAGRKKALAAGKIAELRRRADADEKKAWLAREFGISCETLYQYLR